MKVHIIGVSDNINTNVSTYGKPVVLFAINIDHYKMYLAKYQDKNDLNEGDFFDGIPAEISNLDDPRYDFGSTCDPAIEIILKLDGTKKLISNNSDSRASNSYKSINNHTFTTKSLVPLSKEFGLIKTLDNMSFKETR